MSTLNTSDIIKHSKDLNPSYAKAIEDTFSEFNISFKDRSLNSNKLDLHDKYFFDNHSKLKEVFKIANKSLIEGEFNKDVFNKLLNESHVFKFERKIK